MKIKNARNEKSRSTNVKRESDATSSLARSTLHSIRDCKKRKTVLHISRFLNAKIYAKLRCW